MTTVYVVTSGCYSDYRIEGIFSTREKAEVFEKQLHDPDSSIVEWDVDVANVQTRCVVSIDFNGNEIRRTSHLDTLQGEAWPDKAQVYNAHWNRCVEGSSYRGFDVALKAARDKLAQLKAEEADI